MYHNFSANRLNDYVEFFSKSDVPDEYGVISNKVVKVFDARANVDVKSGSQLEKFGVAMTSSVITVLMWYSPLINSAQIVRWMGDFYELHHFAQSNDRKSMLVTCERLGDQSIKLEDAPIEFVSYYQLDGSTQYFAFKNDVEVNTDFELEINATLLAGSSSGGVVSGESFMLYFDNGNLHVDFATKDNVVNLMLTGVPLTDCKPIVKVIGGVASLAVDDNVASVAVTSQPDFTLNSVGAVTTLGGVQDYIQAQLWDLKVWADGDREYGAVVIDLPMTDRNQANYQAAKGQLVQGEELWLWGDVITNGDNPQPYFTFKGIISDATIIDRLYMIEFDHIVNYGTLEFVCGGQVVMKNNGSAHNRHIVKANSTSGLFVRQVEPNTDGHFVDISVMDVTDMFYAEIINYNDYGWV